MAQVSGMLATTCAENIALFSLLHSIPNSDSNPVRLQSIPFPPSSNRLEPMALVQEDYALSLYRERNLASTLAFLAQTDDDPNYIPAVCVEQGADSTNLNILFAVNKKTWPNGDGILRDLKSGFDNIFSILTEVSDRTQPITSSFI